MILSTNGEAIIGKWLMDSPLFVYKLCLGTEQKDVFVSIFFALLPAVHCLQLQAAVPYEAFCHALQKKKRKALIFCVLKPARWHKETIRKPVLRDYQTNYRAVVWLQRSWQFCVSDHSSVHLINRQALTVTTEDLWFSFKWEQGRHSVASNTSDVSFLLISLRWMLIHSLILCAFCPLPFCRSSMQIFQQHHAWWSRLLF